jgi:uncharacterized delta-60 repeat protein
MRIRDRGGSGELGTSGRRRWSEGRRSGLRPVVEGLEKRVLLSAAGDLDTSFGDAGVAQIQFPPAPGLAPASQAANAVAIDSSGNIVAAGFAQAMGGNLYGSESAVARLTPNGVPDANFGPSGQVVIYGATQTPPPCPGCPNQGYGYVSDGIQDIVQDSAGNVLLNDADDHIGISSNTNDLVLVGSYQQDVQTNPEFSVVALSSSSGGQFTDSYGNNEVATASFSALDQQNQPDLGDFATAGLLQPNGTILVTGVSGASDDQIPLARFEIDGSSDTSFGSSGTELLAIPGETSNPEFAIDPRFLFGLDFNAAAMAFQGPAHILVADTASIDGQSEAMLVRLNSSDDTIDSSFGNMGVALVPVPSGGPVSGIAVDPLSGRIAVAGSNYLVALTPSGQPDRTFAPSSNGVVSINDMIVKSVAIQSDSKIVVAGSANGIAALARYDVSGDPDTTFGPAGPAGMGLVTTDIDGRGDSEFYSVAIQPSNGEIVAAGYVFDLSSSSDDTVVARYVGLTPEITALSPPSATQGQGKLTLTVAGDNFVAGSQVLWNGNPLSPPTGVSATSLTTTIPASYLTQAGPATITVSNPGNVTSNPSTFTVTPPLQSITVTPAKPTLSKGTTLQFTAIGTYTDQSTQNLTSQVTWASATPSVASINSRGLATAAGIGASTIRATLDGISGTTVLTVTAPALQSIAIAPAGTSLAKGLTQEFTATGTYTDQSTQDLTGQVTWASATQSVATITNDGLATGAGIGTSSISATLNGITRTTILTVTAAVLESIAVTPANPSVLQGQAETFTATGTYSDKSTRDLTGQVAWASSNASAASITPAGVANGESPGTSTISATLPGITGTTVLTVIGQPQITRFSPASALIGGGPLKLTVNGANFVSGCTVFWNQIALTPTLMNSGVLNVTIPASDLATAGTAQITVSNPGNVTSNQKPFPIVASPPSIKMISQSSAPAGTGSLTLTVTGTGFYTGYLVLWNGAPLSTTFNGPTSLIATIPPDDFVLVGPATLTVSNGGTVTSNRETFTVVEQPVLTKLSPVDAKKGGAAFKLTVTGDNFVNGSTVEWNGTALKTVFENSTTLIATVPAADLVQAATVKITVNNLGDSTSNFLLFYVTGPPYVTSITTGSGPGPYSSVDSIIVSFNEPMSTRSVQNTSLYSVLGAVTVKRKTKYSKLSFRVAYNARAMTATLTLSAPYNGVVQVTVKSGIEAANGLSTEQPMQKSLA